MILKMKNDIFKNDFKNEKWYEKMIFFPLKINVELSGSKEIMHQNLRKQENLER